MHCVSSATLPALEETAAATPTPKIFQLYVHGDDEWTEDIIGRVKQAGYAALALTVDVAHYSRRERPMLTRYPPPTRRDGTRPSASWQAALTWDTMDQIKEMAGLPFMLKGVQTAEDAEIAVAARRRLHLGLQPRRPPDRPRPGQPGHAARDRRRRSTGEREIIVDGGVQRGSDILKAVALGADVVALGRLQGWGLAAAGTAGVVRMLEILEDELIMRDGPVRPAPASTRSRRSTSARPSR